MGMKGKFIRWDGQKAIFGSKNKPEWRPMAMSANLWPAIMSDLEPGQYYEIELENNAAIGVSKLAPMGDRGSGGSPGTTQPRASQGHSRSERSEFWPGASGVLQRLVEKGDFQPDHVDRWVLALWRAYNRCTGLEAAKGAVEKPIADDDEFNDRIPF